MSTQKDDRNLAPYGDAREASRDCDAGSRAIDAGVSLASSPDASDAIEEHTLTEELLNVSGERFRAAFEDALIFVSDMDDRKTAETELYKIYDELELDVHKRTAELVKMNDDLQAEIARCKQEEVAVRDREEIYRWIVETAGEGIWILDDESSTIFVNQKMAGMLGYAVDEIMNTQDLDKEWRKIVEEKHCSQEPGCQNEYRLVRKDGTDLWVAVTGNLIFQDDGSYGGVIGMLTDITGCKQTEEELRATEELFWKSFHSSPCLMSIVSCTDSKYIDVNDVFLSVTGLVYDEVVGRHDGGLGWVVVNEEDKRILQEEAPFKNLELRLSDSLGQEIEVLLSRETITLNSNPCFLYAGIDITGQKKSERKMSYQEHLNLAGQTTTGIARDIGNAINLVWRCLKSLKIKRALPRGGIVVSCIALVFLLTTAYPRSNFGDEKYVIQTGPGNVAKSTFVQLSYLQASAANLHQQPQVLSTYNGKVAVLMYHDVGPNSQSVISITPQHLDADLTLLQQEGFHIIPISQMVDFMDHRATVPEKAVVLTFDDGYQGVYQYAFPILKKHHAPATIFIIGYTVGKTPGYFTWPEAQEMEASGLVTVGGHTYNLHWQGPTIKPNVDEPATIAHLFDPQTGHVETEQAYEARILADSRLLQETFKSNLGHTTPYFAYPYGAYNTALIRILGDAGFRYMFTTSQGVDGEKADPTRLYRITVGVVWVSTKKMPSIILSSVSSSATPSWSYLE